MNKIFQKDALTSIDGDYALWCAEQAASLRMRNFSVVDIENVAEEIESLGRSDRREIENRLQVLLIHLLKWKFQSDKRSGSWKGSIAEARKYIERLCRESPSLANYPASVLAEEFGFARFKAAAEMGIEEALLPASAPYSIEQILDAAFLPE